MLVVCAVLSVSPATSIPKKKLYHIIRQTAFVHVVTVAHPKIDTHKNQLFDVKKKKKSL